MNHLLTFLTIFTTTLTLTCAGKPYTQTSQTYEGAVKLELTTPMTVNTNQRFLLKGKLCGEQAALPFGELILVEIKAKKLLIARRSFILESRFISAPMSLSPEFYRTFMGGSMRNPETRIEVPIGEPMPIEGVDDRPLSMDVNLDMFVYIAEINYKNEIVALDLVAKAHRRTKLQCVHRNCQVVY